MKDKKLKRLSRAELLEMLLIQTKEVERLRELLINTEEQLKNKQLRINNAGNLALAVMEVNEIMETAQSTADQYLANIASMEAEANLKCQQIIQDALDEAEKIREAAKNGKEYHSKDK